MKKEKSKKAGWGEGTDCKPGGNWGKKWILKSKEEITIPKVSAWSNRFVGSKKIIIFFYALYTVLFTSGTWFENVA